MFHTYVNAFSGAVLDMNQVQFMLDKSLAKDAAEWVSASWPELRARGASSRDQAFYDYYCERHREKYGKPFIPDVDPSWDSRPRLQGQAQPR